MMRGISGPRRKHTQKFGAPKKYCSPRYPHSAALLSTIYRVWQLIRNQCLTVSSESLFIAVSLREWRGRAYQISRPFFQISRISERALCHSGAYRAGIFVSAIRPNRLRRKTCFSATEIALTLDLVFSVVVLYQIKGYPPTIPSTMNRADLYGYSAESASRRIK